MQLSFKNEDCFIIFDKMISFFYTIEVLNSFYFKTVDTVEIKGVLNFSFPAIPLFNNYMNNHSK
jgi:hypothetical protein